LFLVWRLLGGTSQVGVFLHYFGNLYLALLAQVFFRKLGKNLCLWSPWMAF